MSRPSGFSWIEKPYLAAMARPETVEELRWLKSQGIELLISLTEEPLNDRDLTEAGILAYHVPVIDMEAPAPEDLDRCLTALAKAKEQEMGVGIHCQAGMGRTGTVLACYFITQGEDALKAIKKVRQLRPSSIETREQEEAIREFADRCRREGRK